MTPLRAKIIVRVIWVRNLTCWPRPEPAIAPKWSALLLEVPWGEKASRGAAEPQARRGAR